MTNDLTRCCYDTLFITCTKPAVYVVVGSCGSEFGACDEHVIVMRKANGGNCWSHGPFEIVRITSAIEEESQTSI